MNCELGLIRLNFGENFREDLTWANMEILAKRFQKFSLHSPENQTNPIFIFEFIQSSIVIHRIGQVKTDSDITKRSLYFDKNQHHTISI